MKRYELTKEQWERVKAILPPERTGQRGRPRKDDRKMLNVSVITSLLLGQGMMLGTLFGQERIGVYLSKPLVAGIRLQHRFCLDMDTRILK